MKSIQPFDLTPTPVNENDQLFIIQYPADPDGKQQLEQSASLCKKVIGFLAFYDCSTFSGSSGSPVVKVVNGKLKVVALHRFRTINEKSRAGSIFTEILRHACFIDEEVTITTKDMVHQYIKTVTWKPLEMYPLLKCLKPVSPKWKILADHLNVQEVATIEKDCNYNAASDEALHEVVTRWHRRTTRSKRTWKTLRDAALEEDDHTLKEYIDKNQLSHDAEPEMHDVALWSKKSPLQSSGWYNLACSLINECEANNIEAKYCGKGSQECLKNVLQKWMSIGILQISVHGK
ncbi:uncharacterized protein [Dysidea avara]|uniref:uncharacterized protein n=1 Tax=Dysidea avara TaxID=196820 RepID=UPI00332257EE